LDGGLILLLIVLVLDIDYRSVKLNHKSRFSFFRKGLLTVGFWIFISTRFVFVSITLKSSYIPNLLVSMLLIIVAIKNLVKAKVKSSKKMKNIFITHKFYNGISN